MKLNKKQKEMLNLIASWKNSDLKQKDFTSQHNISMAKFKYWLKKYRDYNPNKCDEEFIQIKPETSAGYVIKYPNGVEVVVPVNAPAENLKSLIYL